MRSLSRIHRTLGLVCGALWLLTAITGGLLVRSSRLDATPISSPILPATQALEIAHATTPGVVTTIVFPTKSSPFYTVMLRKKRSMEHIAIDAYTGMLLPDFDQDPILFINRLHENLALGSSGRVVLILSGLSLLFMAVSGVAIFIRRYRVRRVDVHRWSGMLAVLPISLAVVTGIVLQVQGLMPHEATPAHASHKAVVYNLDQLLAAVRQRVPTDEHVERIVLPSHSGMPIVVTMISGNLRDPRLETEVFVRSNDMVVQKVVTPESRDMRERLFAFVRALHTGVFAGTISQAMTLGTAILLIVVIVTGFWRARLIFRR
jgi:uncharacterized iron-regulated membrane protein